MGLRISRLLLAVLAAVLLPALSLGTILFQRRWHLSEADIGHSAALVADAGYAVGAGTWLGGTDYGAALILVDSLGDTVAVRNVSGLDNGAGYLCPVNDGGYVIAGTISSLHVFAQKFSATGDSVWTYSSPTLGLVPAVISTKDDGCLIVGRIPDSMYSTGAVKLDSTGHEEWTHYYYDPGVTTSIAREAAQTPDGGYILCGDAQGYLATYIRFVRTDSAGQQIWSREYYGPVDPSLHDVCETPDGGFISVGSEYDTLQSHDAVYIVRIDTGGAIVRTHNLSLSGVGAQAMAMDKTRDGGYIVAATIDWGDSSRVWLIKLDANSDTTWTTVLPGTGKEGAADVRQTADGGYIVAGTSDSAGGSVLLIKTNSLGQLGIVEECPPVRGRFAFSVAPNPASGAARLEYSLPIGTTASLRVYDALGRQVFSSSGLRTSSFVLGTSSFPPGVYVLRLDSDLGSATRKLVVK